MRWKIRFYQLLAANVICGIAFTIWSLGLMPGRLAIAMAVFYTWLSNGALQEACVRLRSP